jgi:hypothetical protein
MSCSVATKALSLKIAVLTAVVGAGLAVLSQPVAAQDAGVDALAPKVNVRTFVLHPNPKFLSCLGVEGGATPSAKVTVTRGKLNDTLTISGQNFKPGLAFDMFTVERSNLLSDATVDPAFTNFGMAWYQSDLEANYQGSFTATIRTILLDQIFGFDPDQSNPNPINTFHVGFWFNDPNDANTDGCTFDVTKPTPFNGEHNAGPVAFISVPNAATNLGPLCTDPNKNTVPVSCNP